VRDSACVKSVGLHKSDFPDFENDSDVCNYCSYSIVNTTWSGWQDYSSCLIDDNQQQNRSKIEYDENYSTCYAITGLGSDLWNSGLNNTFWNWQNVSCDYCTPNRVNTTWSDWYYLESCQIDDLRDKQRNLTEYDENNCYAITGLPSDISNNATYYENSSDVCDYCTPLATNTTWTNWQNYSTCLIDDNQQQNRSKEQYDVNGCYAITGLPADEFANTTFYDYQNISCDYCSYNVVNTTWTDWANISCLNNDLLNQSRNKTEYDENYGSCYAITGLLNDLWNSGLNNTYFEYKQNESCDSCVPIMQNTSKSDWINLSCAGEYMNQSRNWTQYDSLSCVPDNIPNGPNHPPKNNILVKPDINII